MARVVYLHIGAPKTGTTHLQSRLARNRAHLAEHGVHLPLGASGSMFEAALDLIDRPWAGLRESARGEWDSLVARVRHCDGTVVISQEILAAATEDQVSRALAGLADAEVHLVYTARDLARQIPSEWQEGVKHWHLPTFDRFLRIVREAPRSDSHLWFWRVQGVPDVLARWARDLPPSRTHLVTVPPSGAGRDVLWRRFCSALDIDPAWAPHPAERTNPSLGVAEATLLRRLNCRIEDSEVVDEDTYRRLVRQRVVHDNLVHRPGMVPITLPPEAFDWAAGVAEEWVRWIVDSGVDVVGDLQDLRPVRPSVDVARADPDRPGAGAMLDVALHVIEVLLSEAATRPEPTPATPTSWTSTHTRLSHSLRRLRSATALLGPTLARRPHVS